MKNEEKIIGMIESLDKRVFGAIQRLDMKVTGMNKDIGTIKSDVAGLKSDVGTLKSDVGTLKDGFAEMKSSQDSTAETLIEMDRYMREEVATKADLKGHDVRITRLERLQGIA